MNGEAESTGGFFLVGEGGGGGGWGVCKFMASGGTPPILPNREIPERLSQPWSDPVVLNPEPLDCELSNLTTRS